MAKYHSPVQIVLNTKGVLKLQKATDGENNFNADEAREIYALALSAKAPFDRGTFYFGGIELPKEAKSFTYAQGSSVKPVTVRLSVSQFGAPMLCVFETEGKGRAEGKRNQVLVRGAEAAPVQPQTLKRK